MRHKISPNEIREAMIKNPHHLLWNKKLSKWTDKDKQTFQDLEYTPSRAVKKSNFQKVTVRLSDGKEYPSISECRRQNGFYKVEMDKKIREGIEFKLKFNE